MSFTKLSEAFCTLRFGFLGGREKEKPQVNQVKKKKKGRSRRRNNYLKATLLVGQNFCSGILIIPEIVWLMETKNF